MRAATAVMAILALALCTGASAGTFRAATSLVLVNVSVLDPRDRPVTGLLQNQFHILDNGSEQPIRFFAHEDAPLSLRSEEHTSDLQSLRHLVCRLLLEIKQAHSRTPATEGPRLQASPSQANPQPT